MSEILLGMILGWQMITVAAILKICEPFIVGTALFMACGIIMILKMWKGEGL